MHGTYRTIHVSPTCLLGEYPGFVGGVARTAIPGGYRFNVYFDGGGGGGGGYSRHCPSIEKEWMKREDEEKRK